jgi:hypothetical protein
VRAGRRHLPLLVSSLLVVAVGATADVRSADIDWFHDSIRRMRR